MQLAQTTDNGDKVVVVSYSEYSRMRDFCKPIIGDDAKQVFCGFEPQDKDIFYVPVLVSSSRQKLINKLCSVLQGGVQDADQRL